VKADVLTLPPLIPLATLSERLAFNPDLALLGDEVQLRKQALRQARAEGDAEVSWSAGVRRLQMSEDSALVLGLSVPLGAKGRAVGAVATASAQQAGAEQEQAQAKVQLQAQLVRLHGALQQALEEVNSLRGAVLLPLQQAMRATAEAFAQGRYSYLEFHLAQRELLETQLALIDAAARAHLLSSEIERLTPLQPNLVNAGG
jgi:outer membrane protein, heavy metal efflux system